MYKAIDIYLERKSTRQYVGRLQKEKSQFVFQYDKAYLKKDNPLSLGPDLPLQLNKLSSSKLFPSFADRIPSKNNPAYKEYCSSVGISPSETNPLVLLAKLGKKGPSAFVCVPVKKNQDFLSEDLKLFRKKLNLSIREFSDLFGVSSATIYRIENNKTSGRDTLKKLEVYYKYPQAVLAQIKITGNTINESKRFFIERLFKSKIIQKQLVPISPFTVSSEDIEKCNSQQFVELIKRLSLAECYQYNIPQGAVHFSSKTSAKDGGQDGSVIWSHITAPPHTNYFPSRYNCFQIKASSISPAECKKEIIDPKGQLKPALQKTIKNKGAYILCSNHILSGVYLTAREEAIYEQIKNVAYDPKLIQIKFYDANIIANWLNHFPSLAVWFLKEICGIRKHPWLSWEEWSREETDYRSEFMFHDLLKEKQEKIYHILTEPRKTAHLTGISGTGKTRLALEAFRPRSNDTTIDLSKLVLYSSSENLNTNHLRELKKFRVILVIDDCDLKKAEQFHKIAIQEDSELSLLTIGTEETEQGLQHIIKQTTESVNSHIFKLEPDKEITTKMLLNSQNISNKYLDPKFHILTSGLPFMVKLLKDVGPTHLLKDDIPTLRKKMLWGRAEPDQDKEKVIKICSLFDTIGVVSNKMRFNSTKNRGKEEAEYIAEKIGKMDYETFYEKIHFFKKKKIIQQYGDFIQVRPKPLSVWLASEFIEQVSPENLTKWLTEMKLSPKFQELSLEDKKQMEEWKKNLSDKKRKEFNKFQEDQLILYGLRDSFCKQLSYLFSSETAKHLVKKLCNEEGIFGKKETLCTKWGFRCLYHLVDLNPEVVLQTLERVFRDKKLEELKELTTGVISLTIGKTVFPELIHVLEKIAREEKFYLRAGRLLLNLAEIDIEPPIHSQPRQVFINHFQLYLSGTSACPTEKFKIIEEIKSSKSLKQKEIAIEALNKAMWIGGWTCSSELMKTNSNKELEHYHPKTDEEVWSYFRTALNILIYFATKDDNQEIQKKACSVIASNLRSLLKQNLYKEAKEAIQAVVSFHGYHWPLARDKLLSFLKYKPKITDNNKKQIEEMLELLQPGPDLNERILAYITECPSNILYNKMEGHETEKYDKHFNQLISNFVDLIEKESNTKKLYQVEKALEILFHGEQINTLFFAENIPKKIKYPLEFSFNFLPLIVKWKKNNKNFNPTFLSGFVVGLKNHDSNKLKFFLDHLTTKNDLADFLIDSYGYISLQNYDIERLINTMNKINLKSTNLRNLAIGQKCDSVNPKLIGKLLSILMKKEVSYSWDAIHIYNCYVYNKSWGETKQLLPILYKLLTRKNLLSKKYDFKNEYIYTKAVMDILKSEYKEIFSKNFLSQVFNSTVSIFDLAISDDEIKECCKKIVQACPDIFLQELTNHIDNPNIEFIVNDNHSFPSELDSKNSFLFLTEDAIKKWCKKAPDKVPEFLARNISLFVEGRFSSLSKFLLDEYGDQKKIIKAISFNLENFSWSGNISVYFEGIKKALKELIDHKHKNVHDFTIHEISKLDQKIKECKEREQERKELGIW